MRYQWIALAVTGVLILGLGGLYGVQLARESARSHAQLQLLQQIQADFGDNADPTRLMLSDEDLHRLLRESVNQVRGAYAPLERFDLSDPNANLDALLAPPKAPDAPDAPETARRSR